MSCFMSGTEYDDLKAELQEVKEILAVIAKTVAADNEVSAIRTERRLADQKRQADVLNVINQNRQMLDLAD